MVEEFIWLCTIIAFTSFIVWGIIIAYGLKYNDFGIVDCFWSFVLLFLYLGMTVLGVSISMNIG